ncbi:Hypothetical predicted protein [Paramuricea clavata]|uniref:Uncharacterized protein n=1 Tax=Paramuricea clavata TaxID=317549 RepID=A0A7D9KYQ6_PARCT|nr:Hypothetical predicted protein [Paramuricea clavata]
MANIITTPTSSTPSTRQPAPTTINHPPVFPRPRAADFFNPPPPVMEDVPEPEQPTTPPPCPQSLPSTSPPNQTVTPPDQTPIIEDPSTTSFPSSRTTTSLQDFRQ